jgi:iron(III) transport system substrate-binding protein
MLIKGAKHAKNGKILIDYLLSRESEKKLAFADCAQIPLHDGVKLPKGLKKISDIKVMQVDYEKVAKKLLEIEPFLKEW